jgi:hypothetical protein
VWNQNQKRIFKKELNLELGSQLYLCVEPEPELKYVYLKKK